MHCAGRHLQQLQGDPRSSSTVRGGPPGLRQGSQERVWGIVCLQVFPFDRSNYPSQVLETNLSYLQVRRSGHSSINCPCTQRCSWWTWTHPHNPHRQGIALHSSRYIRQLLRRRCGARRLCWNSLFIGIVLFFRCFRAPWQSELGLQRQDPSLAGLGYGVIPSAHSYSPSLFGRESPR